MLSDFSNILKVLCSWSDFRNNKDNSYDGLLLSLLFGAFAFWVSKVVEPCGWEDVDYMYENHCFTEDFAFHYTFVLGDVQTMDYCMNLFTSESAVANAFSPDVAIVEVYVGSKPMNFIESNPIQSN